MKVAVTGGREFTDRHFIFSKLNEQNITHMILGCARGVDTIALEYAKTHSIPYTREEADWDKFGLGAGPERNARMLSHRPDIVIAFPGGSGTANMCLQAVRAKIPLTRYGL